MKYTGTILSRATLAILFSMLSWLPMEIAGRQCPTHAASRLSGYITSPNYPSNYPSSTNCETTITAEEGTATILTFVGSFRLESGCQYDNVKIVTIAVTGYETVQKTHCGSTLPSPYTTRATKIKIKFKSDGSEQFSGFNLTYSITGVCRRELYGENGEIAVSPDMFKETNNCVWILSADQDKFVYLDMNTLYKRVTAIGGESIKVSEVLPGRPNVFRGIWNVSVDRPPDSLTSFTSTLEVIIKQGERKITAGWEAVHTDCGGSYGTKEGAITFRRSYEGFCNLHIHGHRGHLTTVTLHQMPEVACDSIVISDKVSDHSIGTFKVRDDWCITNATNQTVVSNVGEDVMMEFQDDGVYHIQWKAECGYTLETSGTSIPPPWDGDQYPPNSDCEWTIEGMADHMIEVTFLSPLHIEHSNDGQCNNDYIEVLQSTPEDDLETMGRFCGSQLPPQLKSSAGRVVVRFHSDESKEGRGYDAIWLRVCGNVYTDPSGVIQSPGYPSHYHKKLDCKWEIQAQDGHVIQLSFEDGFSLEDTENCDGDHVEIFDILQNGHHSPRGKWCGQNKPPVQISMASKLLVIFHSDKVKGNRGFKATWKSESMSSLGCGRIFDDQAGAFTSPNHPHPYPNNVQCRWEIQSGEGHRVTLRFKESFDLELNDDNCGYDGVEVLESLPNGKLVSYGKWCGLQTIPTFFTVSKLVVLFYSDSDKSGQGFSAWWESDADCGGAFSGKAGHLLSPNFPSDYPVERNCQWRIDPAPGGENVTLRFDSRFELESSANCAYDYVEISRRDSVMGRWCGTSPPPDVSVGGEALFVRFMSDKSDTGKGFLATIV